MTNWYFNVYLGIEIPTEIAAANNDYEPAPTKPRDRTADLDYDAIAKEMGLTSPLRQYQWEGVSFLTRSEAALLADEMGLGKTVQTTVALRNAAYPTKKPETTRLSALRLNVYFQDRNDWNEGEIETRREALFQTALQLWPRE